MKRALAFCMVVCLAPTLGLGQELKDKAAAAWAGRSDPAKAREAVDLFAQLAAANPNDVASRIMTARAAYWVVEQDEVMAEINGAARIPNDQQVEVLDKGVLACHEVLAKDINNVEANYWLMYCMAARTLAKGIFSGFAFRDSVVGTIMVSKGDVKYHFGGVYRYWGAIIYQIPGLLGKFFHFSDEDSVFLYQQALAVEPKFLRTHIWLADVYLKMGKKDLARKEYEFCANQADGVLVEADLDNQIYKKLAAKRLGKM
jgi:hypothetical protein